MENPGPRSCARYPPPGLWIGALAWHGIGALANMSLGMGRTRSTMPYLGFGSLELSPAGMAVCTTILLWEAGLIEGAKVQHKKVK